MPFASEMEKLSCCFCTVTIQDMKRSVIAFYLKPLSPFLQFYKICCSASFRKSKIQSFWHMNRTDLLKRFALSTWISVIHTQYVYNLSLSTAFCLYGQILLYKLEPLKSWTHEVWTKSRGQDNKGFWGDGICSCSPLLNLQQDLMASNERRNLCVPRLVRWMRQRPIVTARTTTAMCTCTMHDICTAREVYKISDFLSLIHKDITHTDHSNLTLTDRNSLYPGTRLYLPLGHNLLT